MNLLSYFKISCKSCMYFYGHVFSYLSVFKRLVPSWFTHLLKSLKQCLKRYILSLKSPRILYFVWAIILSLSRKRLLITKNKLKISLQTFAFTVFLDIIDSESLYFNKLLHGSSGVFFALFFLLVFLLKFTCYIINHCYSIKNASDTVNL